MSEKKQIKISNQFTSALQEYEKGLRSYALYKLNNRDLSIDLVQDTFLKVWNYLMKGGKIQGMKAFLYHILNNLIIDQYRKHKSLSLDALHEKGFDQGTGNPYTLSNFMDEKEVRLLVERLPKPHQQLINMKYKDDLSLEEMSSLTGTAKNTLAVRFCRLNKKLQSMYAE